MNYTSDFFLYKGDEGDFKYLKSEEDMNTPKDEMITEAIHCMVEQIRWVSYTEKHIRRKRDL